MSAATESTCNSSNTETAPPFYFDEKWKLSKKEGSSSSSSSRSISSLMKKSSSSTHHQRKCAFARKCARLVKEQRARFYIIRRCVIMLICWHDHDNRDS